MLILALHFAAWYPLRPIRLFYIAVGGLLLASVIAALAFPAFGVHQIGEFAGQWRGITTNKNLLSILAAMGMILGAHRYLSTQDQRFWPAMYFLMALTAMVMCAGKTSLVSALVGLVLLVALLRRPVTNHYWLPVTMFCGFVLLAVPLFFYSLLYGIPTYADIFGPFFQLLGKEATLTGRDDIWVWLLPIVESHWLLGYGYGAFWVGDFGLSGEITEKLGYYPYEAHNGLLEITNELGVVGLFTVLGFFAFHFHQLSRLRAVSYTAFSCYLPLTVMILVNNISESVMFNGINLYTLALMAMSISTSRLLSHSEPQRPL